MHTLARDLSWLRFNARVLQEAQTAAVPLLERLKFLAIFSSNLDEFFKVRVATLRRLADLKKKTRARLPEPPRRVLKAVLAEVQRQQADFGRTFREELLPALRAEGIHLCPAEDLTDDQRRWVADYCRTAVAPLLTPVALDAALPELFLKDQAVYLTLHLTQPLAPATPAEQVLVLELPTRRHGGRFVLLPDDVAGGRTVVFLDDVVRVGAAGLFPAYGEVAVHSIKLSRDAELDLDEDVSGDVMEKIRRSVAKRATGYPARLLFDPAAPPAVLAAVQAKTGITAEALVEGSRYHNFRDFFGFPGLGEARLAYPVQRPVPHRTLPRTGSLLAAIAERDHLLHPPYHAFDPVPRLLREAAADPRVSAIRITLYRVAGKSAVVKALLKAAKNGKQVTAVVELKARFDEESNLYWAEKLQRAGAHVIFTPPELKCHAKLLLVSRREAAATAADGAVDAAADTAAAALVGAERTRHYAYLSTGNFNEATSELYTDHGLFTADERLTAEVAQVFDFIAHPTAAPPALQHLLVAPFGLRTGLEALIDFEVKEAKKGRRSGIILKVNALEHPAMMQRLHAAAHAGVPVELIVRGINCLVPGDGLTARGLVDRYLEHSRVYVFHHRGEEKTYLSSADWMTRNLERRVEVAFPVLDENLRAEIRQLLDFQRHDNVKARDYDNHFIAPATGQKPLRAQAETRRWLGRRK